MNSYKKIKLSDFVYMNPSERLPKGTIARKISMDQIELYKKFVFSTNYEQYSGGAKFRNGDTIMARITPCLENGKTAFVSGLAENEIAFGSTEYIVLRAKENISIPDFVYYLTISSIIREPAIKSMVGSSGRQRVQQSVLDELEIPLFSIADQQHIVDILGSIDDKIENNGKIIENLEQFAIAEYQKITKEADSFICLGDVIDIFDSKRKPLSSREREAKKGSYRYFGATGVLDYVNNYLFDGEYVLLAEDGTVIDAEGFPIVQLVTGQFWINNHAHIMQAKSNYTNYSLYVALKRLQVKEAVTGAVQLKINQANLCALELPYITPDVLLGYNNMIEPMFKKIIHIRNENEVLNKLKQLYLQKFFG